MSPFPPYRSRWSGHEWPMLCGRSAPRNPLPAHGRGVARDNPWRRRYLGLDPRASAREPRPTTTARCRVSPVGVLRWLRARGISRSPDRRGRRRIRRLATADSWQRRNPLVFDRPLARQRLCAAPGTRGHRRRALRHLPGRDRPVSRAQASTSVRSHSRNPGRTRTGWGKSL